VIVGPGFFNDRFSMLIDDRARQNRKTAPRRRFARLATAASPLETAKRLFGAGRRQAGDLLVGAAIGVGRAATAAERGGADFLLALNAGRFRVRGASSLAAMLPLADANRETLDFTRGEILGRVAIPVFFGACAMDPDLDLRAFARGLAQEGVAGVANFPSAIHYGGRLRAALEAAGLGFGREVEMLEAAKRAGLATFGYAKTRADVDALIAASIDILCVNFGWNAGGTLGFEESVGLDEAAERARLLLRRVRRLSPGTLCVVEGGPIVSPEQMYQVCSQAGADGYVGGSTLDRLPFEISVMQSTSAFKTAAWVGARAQANQVLGERMPGFAGLVGRSPAFRELMATIGRVAASDLPVLIVGEAGAGKSLAARAIHAAGPRRRGPIVAIEGTEDADEIEARLFGREAQDGRPRRIAAVETADSTAIVERIEHLGPRLQARLASWLESGHFERVGGHEALRARARLIATTSTEPLRLAAEGKLRDDLLARLLPARVDLPALRDRLEDLPILARYLLAALPGTPSALEPDAYRVLLRHPWPGNLRELRAVLERCVLRARGQPIAADMVVAAIAGTGARTAAASPDDERGWILEGLRRNRFRRAATAEFLGLSRKTLYNKMRRYAIAD